jgi:4-hydroxy-2-oxoheptanedioate aldolase
VRQNRVKRALREGRTSFGTWLSLGDLMATRVLARLDFDWLTLDMEHSPIDWAQAAAIFAAVADAGSIPLARVPEGTHDNIKRVLDAGAWGIVVPMVETVEQARIAIAAAKYPPEGNRSVGGSMHALNFDCTAGEYYQRANDEILVVLQTESPRGVQNLEEICKLPGLDAIFVGPADLRAQMRKPGCSEPTDHELEAQIQQVIAIGKQAGVPTGLHAMETGIALQRAEQGMQMIAIGSDLRMMTYRAQEVIKTLHASDNGVKEKDLIRY